jgi:hypothetical protein
MMMNNTVNCKNLSLIIHTKKMGIRERLKINVADPDPRLFHSLDLDTKMRNSLVPKLVMVLRGKNDLVSIFG